MTSENRGYRNVGNFEDKSKNYFRKTEGNGRYRGSADNSGTCRTALVFKSQISGIADGVYTTIKTQIKKF